MADFLLGRRRRRGQFVDYGSVPDGTAAGTVSEPPILDTIVGIVLGSMSIVGAAQGIAASSRTGVASGAIGFSGSAAGAVQVKASAAGDLPLTGAATGLIATTVGSASGVLPLTGTATATAAVHGVASGSLALSGSGAGFLGQNIQGAISGSLPLSGSGTARAKVVGTASGSLPLSGSANNAPVNPAVTSTAQLSSAMATASGGDTITVAPGSYGAITLNGLSYASPVTITSSDPLNPALFTDTFKLNNCTNIRLTGLALSQTQTVTNYRPIVNVVGCTSIEIDHNTITGASTGSGYYGYGVVGKTVNGLNVHHNTFSDVYRAGTMDTIQNLQINDNDHEYDQGDAWQCGSITTGEFLRNLFENFNTFGVGHVDCIQLYIRPASTNPTDIPSTNITIANNFVANNPDNGRAQFVFIRSQDTTKRFNNVTITGNETFGTNWYSIQYLNGDGGVIDNNTVWFIDSTADAITDAMIRTDDSTGEASGNKSTKAGLGTGFTESGNTYDRAAMTTDLAGMATRRAAWVALYR